MSVQLTASNQASTISCESLLQSRLIHETIPMDTPHTTHTAHNNLRKWIPLPLEVWNDLNRSLSPSEISLAAHDMQLTSPHTAVPPGTQPTAVILIGAGGAGKTSLLSRLPSLLPGFDTKDFFLHDGDYLRRRHEGFQRSVRDKRLGYIGGWRAVQPHIKAAKAVLLERAMEERRNVLIPTGQHAPVYVEKMAEAGYKLHIIGVFADCETILTRGVKRGHETGREYLGTAGKWEKASRDMLQLVRDADPGLPTSGLAVLLDNRDFHNPVVLTVEQMHDLLVASGVVEKETKKETHEEKHTVC